MKDKDIFAVLKEKLGIEKLNEMQEKMLEHGKSTQDIILLSPTGSGKTVAFTLPLLKLLKPSTGRIQCVIIAPSRELVIQVAGVVREIAKDFRVVPLYGGHKVEDEVNSLKVVPDIVVATPGRLLDHSVRHNLELLPVRILVIDEFDKCLELGFEEEMGKLMKRMKNVSRIILTSATSMDILPEFLKIDNPVTLDFLFNNSELDTRLKVNKVKSDGKDKLASLLDLLVQINADKDNGPEKAIIFVNHRESAERVYDFLKKNKVSCVLYHGALDQRERETAVALFNNGSRPVLVATDLASRGLDIEKIESVIHYHLPLTKESYTHRNGRTARMQTSGEVYVLVGPEEKIADYIEFDNEIIPEKGKKNDLSAPVESLYIDGGKKEKISKGDILGYLIKEGGLETDEIKKINIFDHYSLVAVSAGKVAGLLEAIAGKKIKGQKLRISIIK